MVYFRVLGHGGNVRVHLTSTLHRPDITVVDWALKINYLSTGCKVGHYRLNQARKYISRGKTKYVNDLDKRHSILVVQAVCCCSVPQLNTLRVTRRYVHPHLYMYKCRYTA